jgi:hypothetical protein
MRIEDASPGIKRKTKKQKMTTAMTKMKLLMVRRTTNSRKPTSNASSFTEHAVGTPVTVYYKLCTIGTKKGKAKNNEKVEKT